MLENGFVLLNSNEFDIHKLINDLKTDWGILAQVEQHQDSFILNIGDFLCAIALMPAPIPNGEAVQRAKGNYYCPNAVAAAAAHKAHLMVTVMNQAENSEVAGMSLYSKIVSGCLKQENATSVYTSGTVYTADFYQKVAQQYLPNNEIPIMIWVYIGLGQNEQGNQLYTSGMAKFGKDEMEILNSKINMGTLHASLSSMCSYIISSGLVLKDGETIGFSAEQKWAISRSKSVYAPSEFSLKINIQ